jgi:hypothetical protein
MTQMIQIFTELILPSPKGFNLHSPGWNPGLGRRGAIQETPKGFNIIKWNNRASDQRGLIFDLNS